MNASWQTAVVDPDSTDTLSQDSTTGVWTITAGSDHTSTTYDWLGRTTSATDQRGIVHTYLYDSAGRLSEDEATAPGGWGNVDNTVQAIGTTYDDMGRVQSVTSYADTAETTVVNQVQDAYDGWGNLVREWQANDGPVDTNSTPSIQYTYSDGASAGVAEYLRQTGVIYPDGRDVQYGYGTTGAVDDLMSRLAEITDSTGVDVAFEYLGLSKIVVEDNLAAHVTLDYDPNGDDSFAGFDRFGRIVDQLWVEYGTSPAVTLDEYTYTFDRAGTVHSKSNFTDAALDEVYGYNALDELTSVTRNGSAYELWTLDSLGNWLSSTTGGTTDTKTFDPANEETSSTASATSQYDAAGNATVTAEPSNQTTGLTCVYDAWNRLVSASDGTNTITYQYDGTGRLTERTTGGVTEHDYYSGQQVVQVYKYNGGTFQGGQQYIWSPLYVDTPILRDTYDGSGDLVSGDRLYYTTDANHNVTAVTDSTGLVVERYAYTAFGQVTVYDPNWANPSQTSSVGNTRLFGGMDIDPLTGAYYDNARWYNPTNGTFLGRDPIGYGSGINLYEYVGDNPLVRIDPRGTETIPIGGNQFLNPDGSTKPGWSNTKPGGFNSNDVPWGNDPSGKPGKWFPDSGNHQDFIKWYKSGWCPFTCINGNWTNGYYFRRYIDVLVPIFSHGGTYVTFCQKRIFSQSPFPGGGWADNWSLKPSPNVRRTVSCANCTVPEGAPKCTAGSQGQIIWVWKGLEPDPVKDHPGNPDNPWNPDYPYSSGEINNGKVR